MAIVNLYTNNIRGHLGFFGTPLTTTAYNVIIPSTLLGGTIISNNQFSYGAVAASWSANSGGWGHWSPNPQIIPPTAKVEYAFLVWATAYHPGLATVPPYEVIGNLPSIVLKKPDGTTVPVTPNPAYHQTYIQASNWRQYTNGADITAIMQDNQYGNYTLYGVPSGTYSGSLGLGGWGMYILYKDDSFPYRNIDLNVSATGFNTTVTISNLVLPVTGPVNIGVYLASVQGDSGYSDSLLLNGVKLFGPFNPVNDFMNSKYVDYTGLALQTVGGLLPSTLSQYGIYADQTVIFNNNILTNTTTNIVLYQDNAGDWAGVSFLGLVTSLNAANLSPSTKLVNKAYSFPGDTVIYTISFTNLGSTDSLNTFIIDTLPTGLSFVNNSLNINSISYPGDITQGITVPDLAPYKTMTITFSALVDANISIPSVENNSAYINYDFIPSGTTILNSSSTTNVVTTTIISVSLVSSKFVDKEYCSPNDILSYTLVVSNPGSLSQYNIKFTDTLPSNVSINAGTLNQDGTTFSYNPLGMTLPNSIPANSTSTISFKVTVLTTLVNPILNNGTFVGTSSIANTILTTTITTNITTTTILYINILSNKSVDSSFATTGSTITYTILLTNTGNIPGSNLYFFDTLPSSLTYISDSFALNGSIVSGVIPESGIQLGTISPNEVLTLTFSALVN